MQEASEATSVRLDQIGQIALTVNDIAAAIHFYRDVLGMTFLFSAGTMAFFQCDSIRLLLGLSEIPVSPAGTILYFKAKDIHKTHDSLRDQGVVFVQSPHLVAKMPDHDLWIAIFKDPGENMLALMSEVRRTV